MADNGIIGRNPFAIKSSTTPTRGSDDQPRESRPLVAPPTLVLGQEAPRSSGFVLKPSSLAAQASNLKIYNTLTSLNNVKADCKDSDRLSGEANSKKEEPDRKPALIKDIESAEKQEAKEGSDEKDETGETVEREDLDESAKSQSNPKGSTDGGNSAKKESAKSDRKPSQDLPEAAKSGLTVVSKAVVIIDNAKKVPQAVFGKNLENRVANVSESSFVFGQNIGDRVTNAEAVDVKSEAPTDFAEAASVNSEPENKSDSPAKSEKRSLNETAEEYQQRMDNDAKKSKLEEVEVVTGEEDERNVVQINCKLYIFEGNQYLERGRGVLRLNDKQNPEDGSLQSRVVMRSQGILRVVLNTKVWAGMSVEYANDRSLRMAAHSSDGTSAIYLIRCSSREAEQLYSALEWRIQALRNGQATNNRDDEQAAQDEKGDQDNTDSNSNTIG